MFKRKLIILFIILTIVANNLYAQGSNHGLSAYEGLHFIVGFMENEYYLMDAGLDLNIFIAAKEMAQIKITYPDNKTNEFKLSPDSLHREEVDAKYEYRGVSEQILKKGIQIDSDVPITVYCFSSQDLTSDSYSAIPVTNWGTEYIVVSQPNNTSIEKDLQGNFETLLRESEFMVIAGFDNTIVKLAMSDQTQMGVPAGDTIRVKLNKNECYLVQSGKTTTSDGDLTGTRVLSDKPVSVLSGHVRAPMPTSEITRDHLVEMLLPVPFWGHEYVSVPFGISTAGDYIRIVSSEPNVKIQYKSGTDTRQYEIKNDKLYVEIPAVNKPAIWTSDKPVQVAQLMGHVDPEDPSWNDFDPCMAMLPPHEQFVQYVMFQTPGNVFKRPNQYKQHFASLVIEKEAISYIRLDGTLLDSANLTKFTKIDNESGLYWTILELDRGRHILTTEKGRFAGVLYGAGRYDSYAMVLGASLRVPGVVDSLSPIFKVEKNCSAYSVTATDKNDPAMSGLLYAKVNPYRSYNFTWEEKPFATGDKTAYINATVTNPNVQGRLSVYGQDRAGNMQEEDYMYYKTDIKFPTDFDFGTVFWHDSLCRTKSLVNNSNKPYKIISADFTGDNRVQLHTIPALPTELQSGETLKIQLCFKPAYDSTALDGNVRLVLDCDVVQDIPVFANVEAPALSVIGHNFGKVLIGTSVIDSLRIENRGNVDIDITKVYQAGDLNYIVIDTTRVPVTIAPGAKYTFPITFSPIEVKDYFMEGEAANSAEISNLFSCKGEGVSPVFESVIIDLGNRRIGTAFDTTFVIPNKGNWFGQLTFNRFITKTEDGVGSQYLENYSVTGVAIGESAEFNLPMKIENVGSYEIIAEYDLGVSLLSPINVRVLANGTLPEIEVADIIFADTDIYSTRDTNAVIIRAKGNESLHIKNVTVLKSDAALTFDVATLQEMMMQYGDIYSLDVSFYPVAGGNYSATLLIESDAAPNFESVFDTVHIFAKARVPDIEKIKIELIHDPFINCVSANVIVIITNEGTAPINLDSVFVTILPDGSTFEYADDNLALLLPASLQPGGKFSFDLVLAPLPYTTTTLNIELLLFETERLQKSYEITPIASPIAIFSIDDRQIEIGKQYALNIAGMFPHQIDNTVGFTFTMNLPADEFFVRKDTTYYLNVADTQYELSVTQYQDSIVFYTGNIIEIKDKNNWNFSFTFLTLLDNDREFDITGVATVSDCFDSDEAQFAITFAKVCGGDLRQVKILEGTPTSEVYPTPALDIVALSLQLYQETELTLTLFAINGQEMKKSEKKVLQSGQYLLNYGLQSVPNGNYYLVIGLNGKKEIKLIVINK